MTRTLLDQLSSHRRSSGRLAVWLVVAAVLIAVFWLVLTVGNPLPASTLTMATGPEGSGNAALGLRYREVLKRSGIDLTLVSTAGGFANVEHLKDPKSGVSVALVESGVTQRLESPELVSLGGLAIEPLWVFRRGEMRGNLAEWFAGKRISIEADGSGTRVLFRKMHGAQRNPRGQPRSARPVT